MGKNTQKHTLQAIARTVLDAQFGSTEQQAIAIKMAIHWLKQYSLQLTRESNESTT